MNLKTSIGQVYLTHPKDKNFTTLFEESFTKQGRTVELFVVLEISGHEADLSRLDKQNYQKLAQSLVTAFKRAYIAAPIIDETTFEKALAAINATISRILSHGKVNWYGKFNAAIAAFTGTELSISTTGNAAVYLIRKQEWNLLSDGLADAESRPVKIFANYSAGKVAKADRVILSTNQIFNYLSLGRMREFLTEDTLTDTCREIIAALEPIKDTGFATFIFEVNSRSKGSNNQLESHIQSPLSDTAAFEESAAGSQNWNIVGQIIWQILKFFWRLFVNVVGTVIALLNTLLGRRGSSSRRQSKKILFIAIGVIAILLVASIALAAWRNTMHKREASETSTLTKIAEKLDEAAATQIYGDNNRIIALIKEIEELFSQISQNRLQSEEQDSLRGRMVELKNKINKETHVENPTILTHFSNIPTDLLRSPNGLLGFNRNTQSLSFYDFRGGETKALLNDQNTSRLRLGGYIRNGPGYIFLNSDSEFEKLELDAGQLIIFNDSTGEPIKLTNLTPNNLRALVVLGEGDLARLYILDATGNQIWRLRFSAAGPTQPDEWLKDTAADLSDATDMAVDGNIYLVNNQKIEKYFSGAKQDFSLPNLITPLENPTGIFADFNTQFIYVLDPKNERIVVLSKTGGFERQITNEKFRDLSDIYVDESNGLLYALTGSELVQVNLK